jgi:hypothetical protein
MSFIMRVDSTPPQVSEGAFLAGALLGEETCSIGGRPILHRDNVHCFEAVGDVDVVPVIANLEFVKPRMMIVGSRGNSALQCCFKLGQIIPRHRIDRNDRSICSQPCA